MKMFDIYFTKQAPDANYSSTGQAYIIADNQQALSLIVPEEILRKATVSEVKENTKIRILKMPIHNLCADCLKNSSRKLTTNESVFKINLKPCENCGGSYKSNLTCVKEVLFDDEIVDEEHTAAEWCLTYKGILAGAALFCVG